MNKTLKKNLVILGAVTAASFGVSGALTESGLRTALANWMKGDATVVNPWMEVVDFITGSSVVVVDTFADLQSVSTRGRNEGSVVRTRGLSTAGDGGAADYVYSSTASTATNTYSVSVASGGGRYTAITPVILRATYIWDPGSIASNQTTFTNVTFAAVENGDLVLVSHPFIGNQGSSHLTGKATNGLVNISFFNNSGAAIDVLIGTGKIAVIKN